MRRPSSQTFPARDAKLDELVMPFLSAEQGVVGKQNLLQKQLARLRCSELSGTGVARCECVCALHPGMEPPHFVDRRPPLELGRELVDVRGHAGLGGPDVTAVLIEKTV
jgi:hypothetical protein